MKTLSFIILFLLIGAFSIISENKIQLNNSENIKSFLSIYTTWLSTLLDNTKSVTGYVVKMGWLPEPST